MKRALFDVNVVLDVLSDRRPHARAATAAWAAVERGDAEGMLAAHAVTTIYYLVRKDIGAARARRVVSALLRVFAVAPVGREVLEEALASPCPDFEDAVTAAAAHFAGCDGIVTRNPRGFRGSPVRAFAPEAAVELLIDASPQRPPAPKR